MLIQDEDGRIQETGSGHGLGPGAHNTSSTETEVRLKLGGKAARGVPKTTCVSLQERRHCLLQLGHPAATTGGAPGLG